jgi:hypothetical protein
LELLELWNPVEPVEKLIAAESKFSFETPGSSMVDAVKAIRDFHRLRLCVMMMNCVLSIIERSISMKRPMFASSSGASISSSRQNGLGPVLEHAEHQRDRGQRLLAA